MSEKPRRRNEPLVSRDMMLQIGIMGCWLTILSLWYLTSDWTRGFFDSDKQFMTSYFVLFILSALCNGFNVRDDGFAIFKNFRANPDFLKIFFLIIAVQFCIVNMALIPIKAFQFIGNMFSCVPFGVTGWLLVIVLAFTMVPVDLLRKGICKSNRK